jgi:PAS domain-containing protein
VAFFHYEVTADIEARCNNPYMNRLLADWGRLSSPKAPPPAGRFDARSLSWCEPHLVRAERNADGDWHYRSWGRAVAQAIGVNMAGRPVSDFPSDMAGYFSSIYNRVSALRRPLLSVHHSVLSKAVQSWEGLILPVRGEDERTSLVVYNRPIASRTAYLGEVVEQLPIGLVVFLALRTSEGHLDRYICVQANELACRLFGSECADMVGRTMKELMPVLCARRIAHAATADAGEFPLEICRIKFKGGAALVRLTGLPRSDGLCAVLHPCDLGAEFGLDFLGEDNWETMDEAVH